MQVKIVGLLHKRADISHEQFSAHWRHPHGEHAVKLVPVMQRYVQDHYAGEVPGFAPACNGSPLVWCADLDEAGKINQMPEYLTGAYIDEPLFMERRSGGFMVRENQRLPGKPIKRKAKLAKVSLYMKRAPGLSPQAFAENWQARKKPLLCGLKQVIRWVQCPTLPVLYEEGEPAFDGLEELWFERWGDADKAIAKGIKDTAAQLIDMKTSRAMKVDENRLVWPTDSW